MRYLIAFAAFAAFVPTTDARRGERKSKGVSLSFELVPSGIAIIDIEEVNGLRYAVWSISNGADGSFRQGRTWLPSGHAIAVTTEGTTVERAGVYYARGK